MSFDYSDYRHHLEGANLNPEQEIALMNLMWKSMGAAAEKAWGVAPAQNIAQETLEFSLRNPEKTLDSKDSSIKDKFCDTVLSDMSERIH